MTNKTLTTAIAPDAVWIDVSPSFQPLASPFLNCLSKHSSIAHWSYFQTPDEPGSLEIAADLLHRYLRSLDRPVHLIGHGTSGQLGLLYARQFPERVSSLTLFSVGGDASIDWQAHYYAQLELLPCDRDRILVQMVRTLFGSPTPSASSQWIEVLERDLLCSPSPHSLVRRSSICPGGVPVPLLACGGDEDPIVSPYQILGWLPWLKASDRLWQCPQGRHFFHATHPHAVTEQVLNFWNLAAMTATGAALARPTISEWR